LLMGGEQLTESIELLQKEQLPFVVLNRQLDDLDVSFVTADHRQANLEAMRHFIELGHKRIAYIGQATLQKYNSDRIASYQQALEEADLDYNDNLILSATGEAGAGYQAMQALLALPSPPTAVLTVHDTFAIECIQAIKAAGLHVPGDVAVIGSDNLRGSQSTQPTLTTIYPPLAEIGRRSMEGLLRQLSDESPHALCLTLPAQLIIRQSTIGGVKDFD